MIRCKRLLVEVFSALLGAASLSAQNAPFPLPQIPVMITAPQERADFLAMNYWQHYDFKNQALIGQPQITEQAFVDFIDLLPYCNKAVVEKSITKLLSCAENGGKGMLEAFGKLSERYLYDPNSPMRNEELYLPVLNYLIGSKSVNATQKEQYRFQLSMAKKNRVGQPAANFGFTKADGTVGTLNAISSPYVLLFFNDPDCEDCKRVKEILSKTPLFKDNPKLKIVSIYTDQEVDLWKRTPYPTSWVNGRSQEIDSKRLYDLRAIPTLYLLDKEKRVVLKDASIDQVADYLYRNQ